MTKKLKKIFITSFVTGMSVATITIYALRQNSYDLIFFTWGDYTTQEMIDFFEKEENYKAKVQEFNSNESVLTKLMTTTYDMLTPTDYSAKAQYERGYIDILDKTKLDDDINDGSRFVKYWNKIAPIYPIDEANNIYLDDISVPYIYGDYKIVLNHESDIVKDNWNKWVTEGKIQIVTYNEGKSNQFDSFKFSLDLIKEITVDYNGSFLTGNYPRDIMSLGMKAVGHSINSENEDEIKDAYEWWKPIAPKTKFQHNELAASIPKLDSWDIAMAFPGDIVLGILDMWPYFDDDEDDWTKVWEESLVFGSPLEGVNIWFDVLTLHKKAKNRNAVYAAMNHFTKPHVQLGYWGDLEDYDLDENGCYELESGNMVCEDDANLLYGGVEYIYYASPSDEVEAGIVKDPIERNVYEFFEDDWVVPTDPSETPQSDKTINDLYTESLLVHALLDLEENNKEDQNGFYSCLFNNTCGELGINFHEITMFSEQKNDLYNFYYNLIISLN